MSWTSKDHCRFLLTRAIPTDMTKSLEDAGVASGLARIQLSCRAQPLGGIGRGINQIDSPQMRYCASSVIPTSYCSSKSRKRDNAVSLNEVSLRDVGRSSCETLGSAAVERLNRSHQRCVGIQSSGGVRRRCGCRDRYARAWN